ncbi:MAG: FMN-binding negative transcriptional regulator [Burkholderiales bacterium]|nr:FMN-binding negative transcriptional regulator [Burkholderiales bacterium]
MLFIPGSFVQNDVATLQAFVQAHGFATLISPDAADPWVSHLPLLLDRSRGELGTLEGHFSRANGHWQRIAQSGEVLVLFHGPHCYVSPGWYATHPSVPTWNYASVHVHGRASLVHDAARVRALLERMVDEYERARAQPWRMDLPSAYMDDMLRNVVGVDITITHMQGKFKLSQNRPAEDHARVIEALSQGDAQQRAVAGLMRRRDETGEI